MIYDPNDIYFINLAIEEAKKASEAGEVPVGAIITLNDKIISRAYNSVEQDISSIMHAEIKAIGEAQKKTGNWRLADCTMYVTLEPCLMCCGAIMLSRIKRLVYSASDTKFGAVESLYNTLADKRLNHTVEITSGLMKEESIALLKSFFKEKRGV